MNRNKNYTGVLYQCVINIIHTNEITYLKMVMYYFEIFMYLVYEL